MLSKREPVTGRSPGRLPLRHLERGPRGTKAFRPGARGFALSSPELHVLVSTVTASTAGDRDDGVDIRGLGKNNSKLRGCPLAKSDALACRARPVPYLKASP